LGPDDASRDRQVSRAGSMKLMGTIGLGAEPGSTRA
jgi:hypothetical protein